MSISRYYKMLRENRIRVYEDVVFPALTALELHRYLLLRAVFAAKEAFPGLKRSLVHFGR